MRLREFERSHTRIRNRGVWPTTTVFSFTLSKAARLVLAVRGPGPGCELAGRVRIAGAKGLNLFVFDGTIRNRPLAPGTYVLVTTANGSATVLARSYVTIVAPGFPVKQRIRPKCEPETTDAPAFAGLIGSLRGFGFDALPGTPTLTGASAGDTGGAAPRPGGVLGERTPSGSGVPSLPALNPPDGPRGIVALVLLVLFVSSLLGLVVAAVQHLRQQRA